MMLVFQESNFYTSVAIMYFDLVIFGTAVMLIYEDYDNVIRCVNPCFGEYYLDNDGQLRPWIFYREFTYTIDQTVGEFGEENCSESIVKMYKEGGTSLTRELIIAHAIEPNNDGRKFGISEDFAFREVYWEYGGTQAPQGGGTGAQGFLRKKGFHERPNIAVRWDLVSNDAYGRSPGMDALPDVKQLQLEVRRKAQAIDKHVNPPMVADIQLKNQPASLLPGGVTYVSGMMSAGRSNPGFAPAYGNWTPSVGEITEDLKEIRERIKRIFFNDLFQTATQYETRSNVTALEWDLRKSESLTMLGPVLGRMHSEGLSSIIDRTFAVMARAGVFPDPPEEIAGQPIDIEFVSMLAIAQNAAAMGGIERILGLAGNLAGVDPAAMDNIDIDYALDKASSLMNNDPKMIRSPEALNDIRLRRQQDQQQAKQAEMAEKLAAGAKTLSETDVGGGVNALQQTLGG